MRMGISFCLGNGEDFVEMGTVKFSIFRTPTPVPSSHYVWNGFNKLQQ